MNFFPVILAALLLGGCATATTPIYLDIRTVSDRELLSAYYQLNDDIAKLDRESLGYQSQSLTSRSFAGSLGEMLGRSMNVSIVESKADRLRERRREILLEIHRRNLASPPLQENVPLAAPQKKPESPPPAKAAAPPSSARSAFSEKPWINPDIKDDDL